MNKQRRVHLLMCCAKGLGYALVRVPAEPYIRQKTNRQIQAIGGINVILTRNPTLSKSVEIKAKAFFLAKPRPADRHYPFQVTRFKHIPEPIFN